MNRLVKMCDFRMITQADVLLWQKQVSCSSRHVVSAQDQNLSTRLSVSHMQCLQRTLYFKSSLDMPRCCWSRILTTSKGVTMTSASVMPAANPAPIRRTSDSFPSCHQHTANLSNANPPSCHL